YRMTFINYEAQKDGSYKEIATETDVTKFAEQYLEYSPKKIVLESKKSQTVKLMVKKGASIPDGEYRSHFMFLEDAPTKATVPTKATGGFVVDIRARYGVTVPIVIRRGELDAQGKFDDMRLAKKGGQNVIRVKLSRKGKHSYRGAIVVYKKEGWFSSDTEIGRLENVTLYPNIFERSVDVSLQKRNIPVQMKDLKGETLLVKFIGDKEDTPDIQFEQELDIN
ncbi:MAG: hypothetical protein JXR30_00650, partial [Alphaproteobacteria bacterium]|nr:hypothetical protein [Alphaproteobacteria bacterium]